jgi:hypothetical protein
MPLGDTPMYSLTCNCGIKIIGHSEKGLIGLMKRHYEDGPFHELWKNYFTIEEDTQLQKMMKGETYADTTR